jgi:predicted RNase H-like nuclease
VGKFYKRGDASGCILKQQARENSVLGVDGCRAGWVAARLSPDRAEYSLHVYRSFAGLLAAHADAACIAVDIPIGLSECFAQRRCDRQARALLGPRRSSVFPAPDRRLLGFDEYQAANRFSRAQCGKGISQQCFHIFRKIAEVDAIMSPALQERIFEVHPEIAFQAASGRSHLEYPKRRVEGFEERRSILHRIFPEASIPPRSLIVKSVAGARTGDVQPDDILDALIAAWTALRHSRNEHEQVPDECEYDPRGLRMEIIF